MRRPLLLTVVLTLAIYVPGCSEDEQAPAQVVFEGYLASGAAPANRCQESGDLFKTGDFGNPNIDPSKPGNEEPNVPPTPTKNGEDNSDVICSVKQVAPDEFDVSGYIFKKDGAGGRFDIKGRLKPGVDNPNISVTMGKTGLNPYKQDNGCTVRFTQRGQSVAAGRMWGEVKCPVMFQPANENQPECEGNATFKFENCGQ
jgi:hypothetical protein